MKIISFGDVHEDTKNLEKIGSELRTSDLIIISGDLTNYHGRCAAERVINEVRGYNRNILAQFGNLDLKEVDDYLSSEGINLHANGYIFGDLGIFGVGGSNPTPFNTPSEFSEKEIESLLLSGHEKVKDCRVKIMVPHMPPKDTNADMVTNSLHVGSKSVREFIMRHKPEICLTGHIHEGRGSGRIGDTLILNAGMFKNGGYIEVIYHNGRLAAELKIIG